MKLEIENYRGRKLQEVLPRLEKYKFKLSEVSPPNQEIGTGTARVLDIREKEDHWEVLFSLEDYF